MPAVPYASLQVEKKKAARKKAAYMDEPAAGEDGAGEVGQMVAAELHEKHAAEMAARKRAPLKPGKKR